MAKLIQLPDEVRYRWSSDWPRRAPVKCVWLKRVGRERRWLRRYSQEKWCKTGNYCDASVWIGDFRSTIKREYEGDSTGMIDHADPRWPQACDVCGKPFRDTDHWQYNRERLYSYKGPYGHLLVTTRNAPPGSIYNATWLNDCEWATGPDGLSIMAVCPGGSHWLIDQEASNCTLPQAVAVPGEPGVKRFKRTHYCWVRHGDPKKPETLHVDKSGVTCAAGAGSIATTNYHGFLHHGEFTAG